MSTAPGRRWPSPYKDKKSSKDKQGPEVELFIEANEHGGRKVIAPKTGTAAFAKSDIVGWGVFGVA